MLAAVKNRLCLHEHTHAAAVGRVVDTVVFIRRKIFETALPTMLSE